MSRIAAGSKWFGALGLAVLVAVGGRNATGCETPVYRYAMYRWQPAPYEVYYFHSGGDQKTAQQMELQLSRLIDAKTDRLNAAYRSVDLAANPNLKNLLPDVKQAWQQGEKLESGYLVMSPMGIPVFRGQLADTKAAAIANSPARKKLAGHLAAGKACVFVLLAGSDKDANAATREQIQKVLKDIEDGKVPLYTSPSLAGPGAGAPGAPGPSPSQGSGDAGQQPDAVEHEVAWLEVDRSAADEQWFARSLLAVEADLKQFEEPMVFAVYGRARALPPFIGKGINRDNLLESVQFVTGACSCTVKEQNPGVDLLLSYDWEAAAAAVADKFGSEEGNESQFGPSEFFPDLILPPSDITDTPADTDTNQVVAQTGEESPTAPVVGQTEPADSAANSDTGDTDSAESEATDEVPPEAQIDDATSADAADASGDGDGGLPDDPAEGAVASVTSTTDNGQEAPAQQAALSGMLLLGGVVAVALIVLFGATLLVMRPR